MNVSPMNRIADKGVDAEGSRPRGAPAACAWRPVFQFKRVDGAFGHGEVAFHAPGNVAPGKSVEATHCEGRFLIMEAGKLRIVDVDAGHVEDVIARLRAALGPDMDIHEEKSFRRPVFAGKAAHDKFTTPEDRARRLAEIKARHEALRSAGATHASPARADGPPAEAVDAIPTTGLTFEIPREDVPAADVVGATHASPDEPQHAAEKGDDAMGKRAERLEADIKKLQAVLNQHTCEDEAITTEALAKAAGVIDSRAYTILARDARRFVGKLMSGQSGRWLAPASGKTAPAAAAGARLTPGGDTPAADADRMPGSLMQEFATYVKHKGSVAVSLEFTERRLGVHIHLDGLDELLAVIAKYKVPA